MRVACLRIPNLPLAAELRAHPELVGTPLGVASGPGPRAELVAISPEASLRGARRLASVAQARAACPDLRVRVASPATENAARAALLDAALGVSPRAALEPPASGVYAAEAAVLLDASGITSLFRTEEGFAAALGARARDVGLQGDVAVASSRSAARVAARTLSLAGAPPGTTGEGRVQVVPPGGEAAFLAPLSIDLLDPDDRLSETLSRFGVCCVRDLLSLPRRQAVSRLGPEALHLIALARGAANDPPLPVPEHTAVAEAVDLEFPVDRLEPLGFALRGLLSRLLARLSARHLVCADLALRLDLEGGGRDARRIGVAAPTLDARVLLRLLLQALESRPPRAPAIAAALETQGIPLRADQLDLFRPAGPAPSVLSSTVTELESLCGSGRVGSPVVADDHRPEAYGMERFAPPAGEPRAPASRGALAVRALRPPVHASVRMRRGVPAEMRSAVANGQVVHAAGPWRTTGGWWSREERFAYDYFDVQTSDGVVARLRFDHVRRLWEIDAVYD